MIFWLGLVVLRFGLAIYATHRGWKLWPWLVIIAEIFIEITIGNIYPLGNILPAIFAIMVISTLAYMCYRGRIIDVEAESVIEE